MLGLAARFSKILGAGRRDRSRSRAARPGRRLACEGLEAREMLSGLGTDYTYMGGQWDNSRTISFSVAPDGVNWDQGTNDVNAKLDAEFSGTGWQAIVARALQTWAAVTNLNFTQVPDGPYDFNASGVNQGDPNFGDIRIGGYDFGSGATIARTYGPPPNGQTGAGDVELNTSYNFGPGQAYDFQTVILHELGHSLGLGESPQPASVMYTYYSGVRQSLSAYDVEGIQSLYGPRTADWYQSNGLATSPSTALDLTPLLNPLAQGQLAGLSLSSIGATEYFSIVAPNLNGSTFKVAAIAQGFSLMSPKISVIDASTGVTLASDAHADQYGDVSLASVAGVQAGHRYLIAVTGATNDVFSVGSYGIQLGFFGGTPPVIPPDAFPYNPTFSQATDLGVNTQPTLGNLTLPSALNYQMFTFQVTQPGLVLVASLGANILVVDTSGRHLVGGSGLLGFQESQPGGRYFVILLSPNNTPVSNYAFAVRTPASSPFSIAIKPNFASASDSTSVPSSSPLPATVSVSAESVATPSTPKVTVGAIARPKFHQARLTRPKTEPSSSRTP